jgi:hypothetical protein
MGGCAVCEYRKNNGIHNMNTSRFLEVEYLSLALFNGLMSTLFSVRLENRNVYTLL